MRQMIGAILLAVALWSFWETSAHASSRLCPPPAPVKEGEDDMRMKEDEFNAEHIAKSLFYLQNDIPNELQGNDSKKIMARLGSSEFWISYDNSLRFIEGYMLKQAALLQIAQSRGSKKTKQKVDTVKRFCDFLGSAEYTD
jgi:hypothetical protein